jgi:hypothetical protein
MKKTFQLFCFAAVCAVVLFVAGCGNSAGFTGTTDIKTPEVQNRMSFTYDRGRLVEAIDYKGDTIPLDDPRLLPFLNHGTR